MQFPSFILGLCAFSASVFAEIQSTEMPNNVHPKDRRFEIVDGVRIRGCFADVTDIQGRVFARYDAPSDSGVELEFCQGHRLVWQRFISPSGIDHSKYKQVVDIEFKKDTKSVLAKSLAQKQLLKSVTYLAESKLSGILLKAK